MTAAPAQPWLELRLLGTPTLRRLAGAAEPERLGWQDAALLALLALEAPVARLRAAAWIWPDSQPRQAMLSLRQRMHRLKRRAGADLVMGEGLLELAPGVVHDLAATGHDGDDPAAAEATLLAPFEAPAEGPLADWLRACRERITARRAAWLAGRAEALLHDGRLADALLHAERLLALTPDAEHAQRRVMRIHYLRGDRAAALQVFQRCRRWLRQALGVEPSAETLALARQIDRAELPPLPPARPLPLALLRPPALVGREADWRALGRALDDGCRLILVDGEAGVGKSRLVGDFAAALGPAARLAQAGADRSATPLAALRSLLAMLPPPAAPWVQAGLGPLLGADLGPGLDPGPAPAAVLAGADALPPLLAAAAAGWRRAGVRLLVLDDAQHADAASLSALLALAAAPQAPACLLAGRGTHWEDSPPAAAALAPWVTAQPPGAVMRLHLGPLGREALPALLRSLELPALQPRLQPWADALWRHAGGNPLFTLATVAELARDGLPAEVPPRLPLPTRLAGLLDERIQALPPLARRLAQLAALAGSGFSAALAAQVLQAEPAALAAAWLALEAAQVLAGDRLAHDLVRDAARRSLPGPLAAALHARIAEAAEALGAQPAQVARHAEQGQAWPLALRAWRAACAQAQRAGSPLQVLQAADALAAAADRVGDAGQAFEARLQAQAAALIAEPLDRAQARLAALQALALQPRQRADLALARARLAVHANDAAEALHQAQLARAEAAQLRAAGADAAARDFHATLLLAAAQVRAGARENALQLLEAAGAAVDAGDDEARHSYWSLYGFVLAHAERRRDAVAALERAVALAELQGRGAEAMTDLANLAGLLAQLGRAEPACERAAQAEAWRRRLGRVDGLAAWVSSLNHGALCAQMARYDEALDALQAAHAGFRASGAADWLAAAQNHLATLWLRLGRPGRARVLLAGPPPPARVGRCRRAVLLARLRRQQGRAGAAALDAVAAELAAEPPLNRLAWQCERSAELPPAQAAVLLGEVAAEAARCELDALALAAAALQARALAAAGKAAAARRRAGQALAAFDQGCRPFDLSEGDFWWLLHQALHGAGDARAADCLARGRAWLREVSATRVPAGCGATLRRRLAGLAA